MSSPIQFKSAEWVHSPNEIYFGHQDVPYWLQSKHLSSMIPQNPYIGAQISPLQMLHTQQLYDPAIIFAGEKYGYQHVQMQQQAHTPWFPQHEFAPMEYLPQQPIPPPLEFVTNQKFREHLLKHGDADWQDVIYRQVSSNEHCGVVDNMHHNHAYGNVEPMVAWSPPVNIYDYGDGGFPFLPPAQMNMECHYDLATEDRWSNTSYTSDSASEYSRSDSFTSFSSGSTPSLQQFSLEIELSQPMPATDMTPLKCQQDDIIIEEGEYNTSLGFRSPIEAKMGSQTTEQHTYSPDRPTVLRRRNSCPDLSFISLEAWANHPSIPKASSENGTAAKTVGVDDLPVINQQLDGPTTEGKSVKPKKEPRKVRQAAKKRHKYLK